MITFLFTDICDTRCLYMKVSVTAPDVVSLMGEVVSLMDIFTDTISLTFQTIPSIQIRIPDVITWEYILIMRGTR